MTHWKVGIGLIALAACAGALVAASRADSESGDVIAPTASAAEADAEEGGEVPAAEAPADALDALPAIAVAAIDPPELATEPVPAAGAGTTWDAAPVAAPGRPAPTPEISAIRDLWLSGEVERARAAAEQLADEGRGRDRDAALMLLGMIDREAGRHNLASESFSKVRSHDGPLARYGAWFEAEQDLARGRASSAVKECTKYRTNWPDGPYFDDCEALIARGEAELGHWDAARAAAGAWDKEHPKAPIGEQIELRLALDLADSNPAGAVPKLIGLATTYKAPLTGRLAEEKLAELDAAGVPGAKLSDDTDTLEARAISMRDSGRLDEAWALYETILARAGDDADAARFADDTLSSFSYRTRHYDRLIARHQENYAKTPTGAEAWEIAKLLGKAGRWTEAAEWLHTGQKDHGKTREWSGKDEDIGRMYLIAGDFDAAAACYDRMATRSGSSGRRGAYYAALAQVFGNHDDKALKQLGAIVDAGSTYALPARYWRAKVYERNGKAELAATDRAFVVGTDPYGWYAVLIGSEGESRTVGKPFARDGSWPGPELPEGLAEPVDAVPPLPTPDRPIAEWVAPRLVEADAGFASLTWSPGSAPLEPIVAAQVSPPTPLRDLSLPPDSYAQGSLFDAAASEAALDALADGYGASFPELAAIADLARIGLYDLSGPEMAGFHEDWRRALQSSRDPKHAAAVKMGIQYESWRNLFLVARDHHDTARYLYGLERMVDDPVTKLEAVRLGWPLAHDRIVWQNGREDGIDPLLVTGLMRQESTYNPLAVSPVGARGAMQIMPRTGHLLANLAHDEDYIAEDLEDPVFAVDYGIRYMGLLMERFGGDFPLVVASYNGGPHNVSAWLKGPGAQLGTDAFVEMIPFRETQNYVKNVTSNYAVYTALYAPPGTRVVIPSGCEKDDRTVVDF